MKRFIITGHSSGLGEALARRLLAPEHEVIGLARRRNAALDDVSRAAALPLQQHELDLSEVSTLDERFTDLLAGLEWDGITDVYLVNNAGTVQPIAAPGRQDPDEVVAALQLNLIAPVLLSNALLHHTEALPVQRHILHISSGAGRKPYSGWSVYCAGKSGLDHYTRSVGQDQPARLQMASLAPGIIDTDMQQQIRDSDPDDFPLRPQFLHYYHHGELSSADSVAVRIADFLLSGSMGCGDILDLRDMEP